MNNTLLLGNGIHHSLFDKKYVVSWPDLFNDIEERGIEDCTFLYEIGLRKFKKKDDDYKTQIMSKLSGLKLENIDEKIINKYDRFGELLADHNVNDLMTTNVDTVIESLLVKKGYTEITNKRHEENIYSIRRKKTLCCGEHKLNVWKMHGDANVIRSVAFGFDQYCGSLAKIDAYVKGKYRSEHSWIMCRKNISEKCRRPKKFDNISWIELFFKTNVYITGFGLDYSEIDIWWLLNKRARFIRDGIPINNKIVYLYNDFDCNNPKKLEEKLHILDSFQVETKMIMSGENMLFNTINEIK